MQFSEQKLRKIAIPYLKKGRAGDLAHAKRVVLWVKKLGKGRKDLPLLVTAGFLHDIGWYGISPKRKLLLGELLKMAKKSSNNSKVLIPRILRDFGFNKKDINKILRLVKAADIYQAKKGDEKIIVDADNLSKLNIAHVRKKYKKSGWADTIKYWEVKMPQRIKTKKGKKLYPGLLKKLQKFL